MDSVGPKNANFGNPIRHKPVILAGLLYEQAMGFSVHRLKSFSEKTWNFGTPLIMITKFGAKLCFFGNSVWTKNFFAISVWAKI